MAKRYNIYYRKYNMFANAYIPYIKVVHSDDVYHEVGKLICTSIERIEGVRYTEPKSSQEQCEELFAECGYRKIAEDLWMQEKREEV